jgi:uncharacterized protein (TIGR02246 family)
MTHAPTPHRVCVVLVMFALIVAPAVSAAPADEASAVIDRWAATFSANDVESLLKLYADDAIFLGTVSPIIATDPAAIRSYFASLPRSGNSVVIGDRRLVVLGDNAVLAAGFYDFTIMRDGNPVASPARFTFVLVKRDGQWLIRHHHSSARPRPPQ